jgi:bacteriocin-like protein
MKCASESLSQKQLTDEQLESVYGGGVGVGAAGSLASSKRIHSFSVVCDISIFSANLDLIPIINIADQTTQICANDH